MSKSTEPSKVLVKTDVITSVCDNCQDVTGFYLGMTCPKCKRPFRAVTWILK